MTKAVANTTIIVGAITSFLALLAAFGVDLSADQKEAVIGVIGPVLALVGVWFHPSIPVGQKAP